MGVPGIFMDLERLASRSGRAEHDHLITTGAFVELLPTYVVPIDYRRCRSRIPSFFGLPYSQPGQDPLRNLTPSSQFNGTLPT
jgi:hypothetical protein